MSAMRGFVFARVFIGLSATCPPLRNRAAPRSLYALILVGLSTIGLGACSAEHAPLTVGDCLARLDGQKGPAAVECSAPHQGQVVGFYEPVGGPYPGIDLLTQEATLACAEAFREFVGSDPLTSTLDLLPLLPTEGAWEEGDTTVVCIAAPPDGSVTYSFEDSHR